MASNEDAVYLYNGLDIGTDRTDGSADYSFTQSIRSHLCCSFSRMLALMK